MLLTRLFGLRPQGGVGVSILRRAGPFLSALDTLLHFVYARLVNWYLFVNTAQLPALKESDILIMATAFGIAICAYIMYVDDLMIN